MAESENDEKAFQKIAEIRSNNSLLWTGLSLSTIVLIITLFYAFGIRPVDFFYQLSISLFVGSGTFLVGAWALYERAAAPYEIKLFDKKGGIYKSNPREHYVRTSEWLTLLGTSLFAFGLFSFFLYMRLYIVASVLFLGLIFIYAHSVPHYFRKKK